MSERLAFVDACLHRRGSIAAVCEAFGISEKTGYKILQRFREGGPAALEDRARVAHHHPQAMAPAVIRAILQLRRRHPLYGPVTLRDLLRRRHPATRWPAASSIGALLAREGLVRRRRRRHVPARLARSPRGATTPNAIWTVDFKGEFRVGGPYCYPLTVLDLATHYNLACVGLSTVAIPPTRRIFTRLFQQYGLPAVIRSDNGVPFAQPNAMGRLGALSYWFVRLGIRPDFIDPGHPAQNGAHERFHRTLKAHTARPPARSLRAQQRRFDAFRAEYNTERPHHSLPEHQPPSALYAPSPRPYPTQLPPLEYPHATDLRLVDANGVFKFHTYCVQISTNLAKQHVALTEVEDGLYTVQYAQLILGEFDEHLGRFRVDLRWDG